jgi:hypothetical protein
VLVSVNDDLTELIGQLSKAADGHSLDEEIVRRVRWQTSDKLLDEVATASWLRLKNFVDDCDIRSRDATYDSQMKSEMKWRSEELAEMARGNDPYGRRKAR